MSSFPPLTTMPTVEESERLTIAEGLAILERTFRLDPAKAPGLQAFVQKALDQSRSSLSPTMRPRSTGDGSVKVPRKRAALLPDVEGRGKPWRYFFESAMTSQKTRWRQARRQWRTARRCPTLPTEWSGRQYDQGWIASAHPVEQCRKRASPPTSTKSRSRPSADASETVYETVPGELARRSCETAGAATAGGDGVGGFVGLLKHFEVFSYMNQSLWSPP